MVIVHEFDKHKYYNKQRRVDIIKYSNGVKKYMKVVHFIYQENNTMVKIYSVT